MSELEGLVGVADKEVRKFRPRRIGGVSSALLLVAFASTAAWLAIVLCEQRGGLQIISDAEKIAGLLLKLAAAFWALGALSVVGDVARRCPPPSWKVRDELKMYLLGESLLPDDQTLWGACLKCGRARYDRRASCLSMWFYVKSAKATEEGFSRVKEGQAFRHAQDVEIKKHVDKRGRWDGYDLRIWYRPEEDVFNRLVRKVKP